MLLNESDMENHPLTPMTDPNLVRVLQRQTQSKVGLIRYDTIAKGAGAIRTRIEELWTGANKLIINAGHRPVPARRPGTSQGLERYV